jgi:hypothetical protein
MVSIGCQALVGDQQVPVSIFKGNTCLEPGTGLRPAPGTRQAPSYRKAYCTDAEELSLDKAHARRQTEKPAGNAFFGLSAVETPKVARKRVLQKHSQQACSAAGRLITFSRAGPAACTACFTALFI